MAKATLSALFLLAALMMAQSEVSPQAGFTLHADSSLVVLNVGVQDSRGANVKGLSAEAFRIYEDGHPQTIKQFAPEDRPVTVGIVVDTSGSMRSRQAETISAALSFVGSSNPDDETFVVNFNDNAALGLPPGVDFSRNPYPTEKRTVCAKTGGQNGSI